MDNQSNAPIIPRGTVVKGGAAYDPLKASVAAVTGQAVDSPDNSKPESVVESQQSSQSQAPIGTTYEELAAKKGFNSADDLAKAYENLEKQKTRVEMGLSELARLRSQSVVEPEPAIEKPVETQEDALRVVEKVVKKITRPLEDRVALQDLLLNNPDVKNYAGEIASIIKDNPGITWETAYKAAKFDAMQHSALEQGRKEAYQAIQQKQGVIVAAAKPRVGNTRPLEDLIKDRNIPWPEVQRIMKERAQQR